jgi:hypothetical protein
MSLEYTEMSHYHSFMQYFGEKHSFQTFDDKGKNKALIKQVHGTLQEHFKTLAELNLKGAGVFFTVNETDQEDPKEIMFQVNDIWKRYQPKQTKEK